MKSKRFGIVCLALALCSAAPADEEKAIRGVLTAQAAAWNKGDLDGFLKGYWDDEKLFFISGAKTSKGFQALKERYQMNYQADGKEMGMLTFSDVHVERLGESTAFVRGKWEVKLKAETLSGWYTLIFRKFPDGWKIIHDHTSK